MAKSARVSELENAILETVSSLDAADGSRNSLQETLDEVRDLLTAAYGETFDDDFAAFNGDDSDDEDEDES